MRSKIRVSAIQRLCLQDGPGVRTTVFLKGCYLCCPWCCNPETIYYDKDTYLLKSPEKCGKYSLCSSCELNGGNRRKEECPFDVYVPTYTDYEFEELFQVLIRDESIYRNGGGITFSGGEPLMQAELLLPLLEMLKKEKLHIAFETTLYAPALSYNIIKGYIDYWLIDLKFQLGFISYYDKDLYLEDFENNLADMQNEAKSSLYRLVYSHQVAKYNSEIVDRLKSHHIDKIEILQCHTLGENKYIQLGKRPSVFCAPTESEMEAFVSLLKNNRIESSTLAL